MNWYHITTAISAERILREGLKPRCITKIKAAYGGEEFPSISEYCYMCTTIKGACSIAKSLGKCHAQILTIDDRQLSKQLLRPDEDWIINAVVEDWLILLSDIASDELVPSSDTFADQVRLSDIYFCLAPFLQHFSFDSHGRWFEIDGVRVTEKDLLNLAEVAGSGHYSPRKVFKYTELFAFLWPACVEEHQTVAYKGIVPPTAIRIA